MKDEILWAMMAECPWPNGTWFHFGEAGLWLYGEGAFSIGFRLK